MKYHSPAERLQLIIDMCEGGNQTRFAKNIKVAKSTISRILKGEFPMTEMRISQVCAYYKNVSAQFLRDGVSYPGDISVAVVKENLMEAIKQRDELIMSLKAELDTQRKIIDKLIK